MPRWVPCPFYEDTHQVSDAGEVRSVRRAGVRSGMVLKPWVDPNGYVRVTVLGKTHKMHHLVLRAFDRGPEDGEETAHLNGTRHDNRVTNLCWKTPIENSADRVRHDSWSRGGRHGNAKLSDYNVIQIRKARAAGFAWKDIALDFPEVSLSTVVEAGNGATFCHLNKEHYHAVGRGLFGASRFGVRQYCRSSKTHISACSRYAGGH